MSDLNLTLVTTAKNEGRFLLEWFAYHRVMGARNFLIYTNDCEDDSPAMLDRLTELGIITHVPNPVEPDEMPHFKALLRASEHPLITNADYVMAMDPDEFVAVKVGGGRFPDLLAAAPDADIICVQMRFFGDNGIATLPRGLVIEHFTAAAKEGYRRNRQVKSLVKTSDRYENIVNNHFPLFDPKRPPRIFNADGVEIPLSAYDDLTHYFNIPNAYRSMQNAQLNHYAVKSFDSYRAKVYRGEAARPYGKLHMGYWNARNKNDVQDTTILAHVPAVKAQVADWLKDPVLDARYKRCFEAYDEILRKTADLEIEDTPA